MSAPWDGRPANPDADGWHWLLVAHGIGHPFPMLWAADGRMWDAGDAGWAHYEDIATRWRYLGPCLTPADHAAAVQAERAAIRRMIVPRVKQAIAEGFDVERAILETDIGNTSALAAAVEAAREEDRAVWPKWAESILKMLRDAG